MTIKEFACLCGCSPQTLRYYDHMNLMKPVKVDQWSGYRYYDEEQALAFVKIKNLQSAGFSIEEIKGLLYKSNDVIYEAFNRKIAEQEEKLQKMKLIQQSYQNEMSQMEEKLSEMREMVSKAMQEYDPAEEFGIDRDYYNRVVGDICDFFEGMISGSDDSSSGLSDYSEGDDSEEEYGYLDFLNNPEYEVVYEKHDWRYVREFLDEFYDLDEKEEYALYFEVVSDKADNSAFVNTMLGILIEKYPEKKGKIGCNVTYSKDGKNHFWLLKRS